MKEKLLEFEKIFLSFTPEERNEIVNYLRKSAMNKLHEEIRLRIKRTALMFFSYFLMLFFAGDFTNKEHLYMSVLYSLSLVAIANYISDVVDFFWDD